MVIEESVTTYSAAQLLGLKYSTNCISNNLVNPILLAPSNFRKNEIEKGILAQKDLIDILGISKQQVSRLLSFRRIPTNLTEAIGDLRKISARTSEELCRLSSKGSKYLNVLIDIAPDIATCKYGHKSLKKEIDSLK